MEVNDNILMQLRAAQEQVHAAMEAIRYRNQHLPEEQLELALGQLYKSPSATRTSWTGCPGSFQSPDNAQPLKTTRSEGPSTQPSRCAVLPRSPSDAGHYSTLSNYDHRNPSVSAWRNDTSSLASRSGLKRRREPSPKSVEVKAYDPEEYVSAISDPAILSMSHELLASDIPANYYHDQIHLSIDTDSMLNRSLSLDGPSTPSTPATALTEASTLSSQVMSRNGSINNSLTQGFNLLRVNSNFSFTGEDNKATLDLPTDFNHHQEEFMRDFALYYQSDPKFFVHHDQNASATSSFSPNEFSSHHLSASSQNTLLMKRLSSTQSSESDLSTSQSRSSRRHQEQIQQANNCRIAPKVNASENLPLAAQMVRIRSEDGSMQMKAVIAKKTVYQRPQHPKLFCELCKDVPDGFRGDHELQRHMTRAHPKGYRRFWVCEDLHGDGKFLENCKACRARKRYGAYYNAAAHLRRAHFNPRKRGRKAKTEAEKRGGKGGGNWPEMDILKERWMREVVEAIDDDFPPVDIDNNVAAIDDAEDEQQGEQELSVSIAEPPSQPSSVSLSPDDLCNNFWWTETVHPFTTDCSTYAAHDSASNNSSACYSFDSQQAFPLPEMESFIKLEDLQPQHAISYPDHYLLS